MTRASHPPLRRGASIAVFKGASVLLVKRAKPPWQGLWSLPGGRLEIGEAPRDAAYRELKEETGIEAAIEGLLDTIEISAEASGGDIARYRLDVFYGRHEGGRLGAGGDAALAQWFAVSALEKLDLTEGAAGLIRLAAARLDIAIA
jgi:8-oxo-dGTP diphosphatase